MGEFPVEQGVLDREVYEARNLQVYEPTRRRPRIHEFLDFQLKPLAHLPRKLERCT